MSIFSFRSSREVHPDGITDDSQGYHRKLPYDVLSVAEAENGGVGIHPDDRRFGTLMIGVQGTGKTSLLIRTYLNDIKEVDACCIVIDPKSELVRTCLKITPPDIGKKVWFLDLGRPAFGMTPLLITGDAAPAMEFAAIAESVVASLLAINEGQIFQSSRRYLYHATIGALAIAYHAAGGADGDGVGQKGKFEDVYALLLPKREDMRIAAFEAAYGIPDLDQTAEFFRKELPDDLSLAGSAVAQRLDAPRNKVSLLTGVPPLRRFFNHPTNLPLREIIENKDILLVDLNMAAIGEDNAQACLHFIFQMLHRQMQRQIHIPAPQRPRVALLCDEAHYLATRGVIKQIATHRAAGLDVTLAAQYFAQFGSTSESAAETEEIRKGISNLLNSKWIGRLSDPDDAIAATRVAQAVFSSNLKDDPDSRARMRVTPDEGMYRPNFYFLASLIAGGERASAFIARTFPIPEAPSTWADIHLQRQSSEVGEYPEDMASTYTTHVEEEEEFDSGEFNLDDIVEPSAADQEAAHGDPEHAEQPSVVSDESGPTRTGVADDFPIDEQAESRPTRGQPDSDEQALTPDQEKLAAATSVKPQRGDRILKEPNPPGADNSERPSWAASNARSVVGLPVQDAEDLVPNATPDKFVNELAVIERITGFGKFETAEKLEAVVLNPTDFSTLLILDRAGLVTPGLLHLIVAPDVTLRSYRRTMLKLHNAGLVSRATVELREATGRGSYVYQLTRAGLTALQAADIVDAKREWRETRVGDRALRLPHDMQAIAWLGALSSMVGPTVVTENWATPRYRNGMVIPPKVGTGRNKHPLAHSDLEFDPGFAALGADLLSPASYEDIKPDIRAEIRVPSRNARFDLLLEFDRTDRASYNQPKFRAYDTFLTGWYQQHRRYTALGRPVVLFLCTSADAMRLLAAGADEEMDGRIGRAGAAPHDWYYAGRDHTFFGIRSDLHYGSLRVFGLPSLPKKLRGDLTGTNTLPLREVALLPTSIAKKFAASKGPVDQPDA